MARSFLMMLLVGLWSNGAVNAFALPSRAWNPADLHHTRSDRRLGAIGQVFERFHEDPDHYYELYLQAVDQLGKLLRQKKKSAEAGLRQVQAVRWVFRRGIASETAWRILSREARRDSRLGREIIHQNDLLLKDEARLARVQNPRPLIDGLVVATRTTPAYRALGVFALSRYVELFPRGSMDSLDRILEIVPLLLESTDSATRLEAYGLLASISRYDQSMIRRYQRQIQVDRKSHASRGVRQAADRLSLSFAQAERQQASIR